MNKYVNGKIVKMTEADVEKAKARRLNRKSRNDSSATRIKALEDEIKELKELMTKEWVKHERDVENTSECN